MKRKILIVILGLIFLYCIGGVIYSVLIKNSGTNESDDKSSILKINGYDYKIDENVVSSLYKDEFNILKTNLENEDVSIDEYVKSVAKLYIIDLYSMQSKINKYDITASQYVSKSARDNFELKVSETLYKYILDNSNGNRNQELPLVTEIFIDSVENGTYIVDDISYDSYVVDIKWIYEKDLGYDAESLVTLINEDGLISVVEQKEKEVLDN